MFDCKIKVSLLLIILLLAIAESVNADFSGKWCWDKNSDISVFSLIINKTAMTYTGGYSLVTQQGDRIDDNKTAFKFKETKEKSLKTKLKAGISGNVGLIQLELINDNKIRWSVLQFPKGEFDAPEKAIFLRCD